MSAGSTFLPRLPPRQPWTLLLLELPFLRFFQAVHALGADVRQNAIHLLVKLRSDLIRSISPSGDQILSVHSLRMPGLQRRRSTSFTTAVLEWGSSTDPRFQHSTQVITSRLKLHRNFRAPNLRQLPLTLRLTGVRRLGRSLCPPVAQPDEEYRHPPYIQLDEICRDLLSIRK